MKRFFKRNLIILHYKEAIIPYFIILILIYQYHILKQRPKAFDNFVLY